MTQKSVMGKTAVSSALVQTSVARQESGLISMELFLLSLGVGLVVDSFIVGFAATFLVLVVLIDTAAWVFICYAISLCAGVFGYIVGHAVGGESVVSGIALGFFVFVIVLGWHHWSLAYWRALSR